jgi:hypothetical protein
LLDATYFHRSMARCFRISSRYCSSSLSARRSVR